MSIKNIVGDDFAEVLSCLSLEKLSKKYKIGKTKLRDYIIADEELNKIYRSNSRKDIVYGRKHKEVPKKKRELKEVYEHCPTFFLPLNGESSKRLCETVIRKAIEDEDTLFFESDWYIFFQNLTSLTTTKEEYLKMILERQCQE